MLVLNTVVIRKTALRQVELSEHEAYRLNTTITALNKNERTQWVALFDRYAEFYNVTLPANCKEQVWDWIFNADEPFWCDLALDEHGLAVGFVQYQLMHRSLSGSMVCYLSDLYVNPDQRKSGIGRALIDHVMHFAKHRGIENVRWLTQNSNGTAKSLYETYVAQSEFVLYSVPVKLA